ncbi:MAG: tannase/feruloyl esterase family alpha/beta hydrolase [Spongiibacter sp.]|nr:tannase/feruloyl esterase family alpha/beta hydrolase [Spongiibacter sp.]
MNKKKVFLRSIVGVVAAYVVLDYALTEEQPGCSMDELSAVVSEDTTLTKVEANWFPVQHCHVKGYVTTNEPTPNRVNFRLQLPQPEAWNGRYYFIGLGGGAGRTPILSESPYGYPLAAGFAVAGTDTGHEAFMLNWSFLANEAQAIDHIHRGGHVSAVQTQAMTKAYYNTDSMYRYHSGCSGGGRMGVMAANYHPEDYDGLLIGAPGIDTANILNFMWIAKQLDKLPEKELDEEKLLTMEKSIQAQCDATDGVEDQMVWDPRKCDYDPAQLVCKPGQAAESCFTELELEVLNSILEGPRLPSGEVLYPGLVATHPTGWVSFLEFGAGTIAKSFSQAYFGEDYDFMAEFDFSDPEDIKAWRNAVARTGYGVRASADYSKVANAGAKVVFWHGTGDSAISFRDQIDYYEAIRAQTGSDEALNQFARLYIAPGLYHCFGGPGPVDVPDRLLESLIDWVEKGIAPAAVVTHRGDKEQVFQAEGIAKLLPNPYSYLDNPPKGTPPREFLLCPYPQQATYIGQENDSKAIYKAENWQCQ